MPEGSDIRRLCAMKFPEKCHFGARPFSTESRFLGHLRV